MNSHRAFLAVVVWLTAFACLGRAEEKISISRGLDKESEYHSYFSQIDRLVDTQYARLSVSDQNDLKQTAVAYLLDWQAKNPNNPANAGIVVRKVYVELFGKRKRDLKRVTIEGINVASVLDDHDTLLDHARSLTAAERDECMSRLKRLERDSPRKFGDLLAYVFLVHCRGVKEPDALIAQFASTFPTAVICAKASLQESRNTVWKRVRGYFGTALEYLYYAVLVVLAICLLVWIFADPEIDSVAPSPTTWEAAAQEARRVEELRRLMTATEVRRVEELRRQMAAIEEATRRREEYLRQRAYAEATVTVTVGS